MLTIRTVTNTGTCVPTVCIKISVYCRRWMCLIKPHSPNIKVRVYVRHLRSCQIILILNKIRNLYTSVLINYRTSCISFRICIDFLFSYSMLQVGTFVLLPFTYVFNCLRSLFRQTDGYIPKQSVIFGPSCCTVKKYRVIKFRFS